MYFVYSKCKVDNKGKNAIPEQKKKNTPFFVLYIQNIFLHQHFHL